VFHTTLGLLDVETPAYDGTLDVFRACRTAPPSRPAPEERAALRSIQKRSSATHMVQARPRSSVPDSPDEKQSARPRGSSSLQ
jgi:hypothetical protein